ncbi:MAG: DUF6177 family protein [Rhodoglobus sp.]
MTHHPEQHPAVTHHGDGWVAVQSTAPTIHLTLWLTDLITRCTATKTRVVIATESSSVLSAATRAALHDTNGLWFVTPTAGIGSYNGLTGRLVDGPGDPLALTRPTDMRQLAADYLRAEPADVVQLITSISAQQPARENITLGRNLEILTAAVGSEPGSWGPHEPSIATWDTPRMTTYARQRMPHPTTLHVSDPANTHTASIIIARISGGVEEFTHALTCAGPHGADTTRERVYNAATVLAELSRTHSTHFAVTMARQGRADLATSAVIQAPATPVALLLGAPTIKRLGIDVDALLTRCGGIRGGRVTTPAIALPLTQRETPEWVALGQIFTEIGLDTIATELGAPGLKQFFDNHQTQPLADFTSQT